MTITLCGSIAFIDEMYRLKTELENLGHAAFVPENLFVEQTGVRREKDSDVINDHFNKIAESDAVLITNYTKNNIENYIGPNTLMEMGVAFYLKKKIYLLNPIPEIAWKEEIISVKPLVINNKIELIK